MMRFRPFLLGVGFSFLCLNSFAVAPVVDESDNYASFNEQAANAQLSDSSAFEEDEAPLVANKGPSSQNNHSLEDKVKGLQQDIQELRGQLDMQNHELKNLQQQQLTFYKDIDARLKQSIPGTSTSLNMDALPSEPMPATPFKSMSHETLDEQGSYLKAYDLVKNKRFEEARMAMQAFIKLYPEGGYTANAQYWLGELYMVDKNYAEAITHFQSVLKDFPSSSKAAASTLKIGYALAASGKKIEAKQRLNQVVKNYPDTPTAQLAMTKLRTLSAS